MSARRDPPTGHYLRVAPMAESTGLVSEHLSPVKIRIDCNFHTIAVNADFTGVRSNR